MSYTVTYTAQTTTILRSEFPPEAKHAKFILSGCGDGSVYDSIIYGPFGAKVSVLVSNIDKYTGNLQINVGQIAGNASDIRINGFGNLPHERIIVAGGSGTNSGGGGTDMNGNTTSDGGYLYYLGAPVTDDTQFSGYNLESYSGLYSEGLMSSFFIDYNGGFGVYDEFGFGGGQGGYGSAGSYGGGSGGGGGGGASDNPELPGGIGGTSGFPGSLGSDGGNGTYGDTFYNAELDISYVGGNGGFGGGGILSGGIGGLSSFFQFGIGKGGDGWCGGGGGGSGGQNRDQYSSGGDGGNGGGSSFVITYYQLTGGATNPFTTSEITFERGTYQQYGYVTVIWYLVDITSPQVWNTYIGNVLLFNYRLMNNIIFDNNFCGNISLQANCIFDGRKNIIYLKNVNNFKGLFNLTNADNTTLIKNLTLYCYNSNLLDNNSFFSEGSIDGSISANCIIDNCKVILKNTTMGNNCSGFVGTSAQNVTINKSYIRGTITGINSGGIAASNITNLNMNNCRSIGITSPDSGRLTGNNNIISNILNSFSVGYGPDNLVLNNTIINNSENIYFANIRVL